MVTILDDISSGTGNVCDILRCWRVAPDRDRVPPRLCAQSQLVHQQLDVDERSFMLTHHHKPRGITTHGAPRQGNWWSHAENDGRRAAVFTSVGARELDYSHARRAHAVRHDTETETRIQQRCVAPG